MGQSPEELTSQIEETRERMAGNLDTLQDRVSPSAIVERQKQAAKDRVFSVRDSVKDKVMGSAQSAAGGAAGTGSDVASGAASQFQGTPLAAGLIAFGAGVVLASLLPASTAEAEAAHRVVEKAKEHAGVLDDVKSAGADIADHLKQSATDAAQDLKSSAQESAETVKQQGQASAESVKDDASY